MTMFYHKKEKVVVELIEFTQDEFKLKIFNEKPLLLWNSGWSTRKPLWKLHEIHDDFVIISCFNWADKMTRKWTWQKFFFEMSMSDIKLLSLKPLSDCQNCGCASLIVTETYDVQCSDCGSKIHY